MRQYPLARAHPLSGVRFGGTERSPGCASACRGALPFLPSHVPQAASEQFVEVPARAPRASREADEGPPLWAVRRRECPVHKRDIRRRVTLAAPMSTGSIRAISDGPRQIAWDSDAVRTGGV